MQVEEMHIFQLYYYIFSYITCCCSQWVIDWNQTMSNDWNLTKCTKPSFKIHQIFALKLVSVSFSLLNFTFSSMCWRMCVCDCSQLRRLCRQQELEHRQTVLTVSCLPLLQTFPIPRGEAVCSRWKVKGLMIEREEAFPPSASLLHKQKCISANMLYFIVHDVWGELVALLPCSVCRLIHSISLIYLCVLFLAANVGLSPLRAASSALSAAQDHSWVRHRHLRFLLQVTLLIAFSVS